jgi:UDP-glucose 4-epimerase
MIVPRFVSAALLGKPLFVYGDGTQNRCFAYVGDVVRAIIGVEKIVRQISPNDK